MAKLVFEREDRGYTVRAWYRDAPSGDARVEITRGEEKVKTFDYPAYRVWNIAAHFADIVDDLLDAPASEPQARRPDEPDRRRG